MWSTVCDLIELSPSRKEERRMTGWKEIIVWEFYDAKQNLHGSKYVGELIRCKDCKHWQYESCFVESEEGDAESIILDRFAFDFCSRAERKEETNEKNKSY